jgi:transposase
LGGDRRSGRIEGHTDLILGLIERKGDFTLAELHAALAEQGVATNRSSLWRFFVRHRITLKKSRRMRTSRAARMS